MSITRSIPPAWRRPALALVSLAVVVLVLVLTQGHSASAGHAATRPATTAGNAGTAGGRPVPVGDGAAFIVIARASHELRLLAHGAPAGKALHVPDDLVLFVRRLAALHPGDADLRAAQDRLVEVVGISVTAKTALATAGAVDNDLRAYATDHPQAANLIAP